MISPRSIIQIAVTAAPEDDQFLIAVADDGTLWRASVWRMLNDEPAPTVWVQLPALPDKTDDDLPF
jgi:hypothetical protein